MKPYKRTDRVAVLIQHELAFVLQQKKTEPFFKEVTITHVVVSADFSYAKVFFSLFDTTKLAEVKDALNDAAAFFQYMLAKNINLRRTPKLRFIYDDSSEQLQHLAALIDNAIVSHDSSEIDSRIRGNDEKRRGNDEVERKNSVEE